MEKWESYHAYLFKFSYDVKLIIIIFYKEKIDIWVGSIGD